MSRRAGFGCDGHQPDAGARIRAAHRLLSANGLTDVRVTVAGHRASIAAVDAPAEQLPRVAELADEIKALGFSYVALEIDAAGSNGIPEA